jgi:hypothetical protein
MLYSNDRDGSVGVTAGYEQDGRGIEVWFTAGARDFPLLHSFQTCSGAHVASCLTDTGRHFPGEKMVRGLKLAIHLPLALRSKKAELYIHSPIRLHGVVRN